jgi:tetratricopeptide (TPR) repeat protein
MAGNPKRLSQFWQELKRRRVVHVITVYASASFVIIELVNNLTEPLNLPSSLATIVIIALAVGFPLAIILSWLYDVTSEGVEKTKPLSEIQEKDKTVIPNAWRVATYVSFVLIIGLAVMNIMGRSNQIRPGEIESILILPFQNYTGDDQLDILMSGMHSSLITDVGRVVKVISKTTSDVYKDADKTLSQIASELGVDVVIEPSVLCVGDSICFNLAMNTPEEKQLWNAEYRESKGRMPNLHNQVTKQIADHLKIELTTDEELLLAESRKLDGDAVEAYYIGLHYLDMIGKNSLQKAKEYFNKAIKLEPEWAEPYSGLSSVYAYQMQMSFISPSLAIPKIFENLNKALELDLNSSLAHSTKAVIAVWTEWNWEKGEEEFVKSLDLNPSNAECRMFYAHLLMILQKPDEAKQQAKLAIELDPLRPLILGLGGVVMAGTGDVESAITLYEKALSIDPDHRFSIYGLSGTYRQMGNYEKWFEFFKKIGWGDDATLASLDSVFQEEGYLAAVEMTIQVDEEAAKERYVDFDILGYRYLELNNYDRAMDYYEKAYEIHHPNMPYIGGLVKGYEKLRDNPRYLALVEKMNLPLPGD